MSLMFRLLDKFPKILINSSIFIYEALPPSDNVVSVTFQITMSFLEDLFFESFFVPNLVD